MQEYTDHCTRHLDNTLYELTVIMFSLTHMSSCLSRQSSHVFFTLFLYLCSNRVTFTVASVVWSCNCEYISSLLYHAFTL